MDHLIRDVEPQVREIVQSRRPLLLVGRSMTGKTHLIYQLLKESYADWRLCKPSRGEQSALFEDGRSPSDVIVWLDDLEGYLTGERALRPDWIDRARDQGCIVVATIRAEEYKAFQPAKGILPPQWSAIERFEIVWLGSERDERERIAATIPEPSVREGIVRYGLAEYVGGGHLARERYQSGCVTNPLGAAVVAVAIDWRRLGMESISIDSLGALADAYYRAEHGDRQPRESVGEALAWASETVYGLLQLLEPANDEWRAFDFLVDSIGRSLESIPDVTWAEATSSVKDSTQGLELGIHAYEANRAEDAMALWRSASADEPLAAFGLGVLLARVRDVEGARAALQSAIASDHLVAADAAADLLKNLPGE